MRYGVLGTGMVGRTLATRLVELGNEVAMGARQAGGATAVEWARSVGGHAAREGTFADAARFGEIVVNATAGAHSLDALRAAGVEALRGKVLVDVANPLDESGGFPFTLTVANTDSLGEQIQREFPEARVVKTLNTVNCDVMVAPASVPGAHVVYVCGEDAAAKQTVVAMLHSFGWAETSVVDLGGIEAARGTEMYLALWLRLLRTLGTARFNVGLHVGA